MHSASIPLAALLFPALGAFLLFAPKQDDRLSRAIPIIRLRRSSITSVIGVLFLLVGGVMIAWWLTTSL
jgi:hypothetical protein